MSVDDEIRETHEDFEDLPVRCSKCGLYSSPDDGDVVATPHGPLCGVCWRNGEWAA